MRRYRDGVLTPPPVYSTAWLDRGLFGSITDDEFFGDPVVIPPDPPSGRVPLVTMAKVPGRMM